MIWIIVSGTYYDCTKLDEFFFAGIGYEDRISYNLIESNVTAKVSKSSGRNHIYNKYEDALNTDEIFKELVIKPTAYLGEVFLKR